MDSGNNNNIIPTIQTQYTTAMIEELETSTLRIQTAVYTLAVRQEESPDLQTTSPDSLQMVFLPRHILLPVKRDLATSLARYRSVLQDPWLDNALKSRVEALLEIMEVLDGMLVEDPVA